MGWAASPSSATRPRTNARRRQHGRAATQRPQPPVRHRLGPALTQWSGARRAAQQAGHRLGGQVGGRDVPIGNVGRARAFDKARDVEPLTATHRVMHHMQPRAQPGRDVLDAQRGRQVGWPNQRAPGQVAGVAGAGIARPTRRAPGSTGRRHPPAGRLPQSRPRQPAASAPHPKSAPRRGLHSLCARPLRPRRCTASSSTACRSARWT
jgi:hypothetical protein